MLKKAALIFCLSLVCNAQRGFAQDNMRQIKAIEDSLMITADSMANAFLPEIRQIHTELFVKQLVRALKIAGSYNYRFDSLATRINIIAPDDNSFRMFNWSVANTEVTRRYYGAIQMAGEQLKLYPLVDYTAQLGKGAEDSVLQGGKWYGALYYRIMTMERDGEKVYTMFGLNASSPISNKKVLDPMFFTPQGVVFGAPIFNIRSQNNPQERIKRFIIEYKKSVQVSMNLDKEMNAIYFDRLESEVNDPNRKYTYVPTGQYDGFRWVDGYWNFVHDLIPLDLLKDGEAPAPVPAKLREQ
ncbi:MAG TPA: hypothetical protein VGD89_06610 [Flavipsychrobacter sp.]